MPLGTTRPTAADLQRLAQAFDRDPAATFVELGKAYLALARPRDAIDVGARGLRADPNNVEGRMMVSRAFAMLHQWKEAQTELLKVVKQDKRHRDGFRLLGEVLMRRADYDRALPVLQHAQNLAPADADILSMLRRAREGKPLDPPPPVPQPQSLPPGAGPLAPPQGDDEDDPTRVADDGGPPRGALGRMSLDQVVVKREGPAAPRERVVAKADTRASDERAAYRVQHHQPPPPEDPFAIDDDSDDRIRARLPLAAEATSQRPAAPAPPPGRELREGPVAPPPPAQPPKVRPRVIGGDKPKDAASAALRQSAAVGENYLNNLLTGGLLDIPNVHVPQRSYDIAQVKLWGRSNRRVFVALFVMLFVGAAGGLGWYLYSTQQRNEKIAKYLDEARATIAPGTHTKLDEGTKAALAAFELDKKNARSLAVYAEVASMSLLLYGEPDAGRVETAITRAADAIEGDGEGARALAVARAATNLAVLERVEDPVASLAQTRADLATARERWPDDRVLIFLDGVAHLRAGDRSGARAAFEAADRTGEGQQPLLAARIARADLLLDDGDYDGALALYEEVLAAEPDHAWGFVGRSLARSERSTGDVEAMSDVSVGLANASGPRVGAWKELALASAQLFIEDYANYGATLAKAAGVGEPRFLARVGLGRLAAGKVVEAMALRETITWYSEEPQVHPLVAALDGRLLLARGLPDAALATVGETPGLAAHKVRGMALFDLGRWDDAGRELDAALAIAPEDVEAQAWRDAAQVAGGSKAPAAEADRALNKLGRQAKSLAVRYVHGVALLRAGDVRGGRTKLEVSIEEVKLETPNPLAYRSYTELADLAVAAGDLKQAEEYVGLALEQNPGYLPAKGLAGRLALLSGDPARALENLADVVSSETATGAEELAYAEALAKLEPTDEDKESARKALRRARAKGASDEEIARVEALLDPAAAEEAPKPKKRRRR